ncbi:hypothetical protein [Streptomyces sp. NPDC001415]
MRCAPGPGATSLHNLLLHEATQNRIRLEIVSLDLLARLAMPGPTGKPQLCCGTRRPSDASPGPSAWAQDEIHHP